MAIPTTDAKLVPFGANFTAVFAASPTTFGGTSSEATALTTAFTAYQTAVETMNEARANSVRSGMQTDTRTQTRAAFVALLRPIYGYVQGSATISDADKRSLGVRVRKTHNTPISRPTLTPVVNIVSVTGRNLKVSIKADAVVGKRKRPLGSVCEWVYTFIGSNYPSDPTSWQFNGAATENLFSMDFAPTLAGGTQVWVASVWVNAKGEAGPISAPVSTTLQGGGSSSVELKIAA